MSSLNATLQMLLPIRRHRLRRAESQLREDTQALAQRETALNLLWQEREAQQELYRQQQEEFRQHQQAQSLDSLQQQRERTQKQIGRLRQQQQQCEDGEARCQQHRRQVADKRALQRQRQKAVEKLEFLLTLNQEQ